MAKKVMVLVDTDFNDMEAVYPYYRMIEEGFNVTVAGSKDVAYHGKYGWPMKTDGKIESYNADDFDAVIIPGGWAPDYMRRNPAMVNFVREMNGQGKIIAAICHAGWMLASSGACKGRKVTSFFAIKDDMKNAGAEWVDEEVVVDGNIITSRKPDDLPAFCREIIKTLEK